MSGINGNPPGVIWWSYVSGPSRLVSETANCLRAGKSVCLCATDSLPFREVFFLRVADALRESESNLLYGEVVETSEDPGKYLISCYKLDAGYRKTETPSSYLRKCRVLENRLLPVVAKGGAARSWMEFINAYKSTSAREGLFLLEIDGNPPKAPSKHLKVLDYRNFVTEYDSLLYAGLISNNSNITESRYITAVAESIFGGNAEGIAGFVGNYDITQSLADALPENTYSEYKLWNAQVQELFPIIVRRTHDLVKAWRLRIDEALAYTELRRKPFEKGLLNSHGDVVNTPDELEIGQLLKLMTTRRRDSCDNETAEYVLSIPDDEVREKVRLLWNMRNTIAHVKICTASDVVRLLRM